MTSLLADFKVLYHLALRPVRGRDHADRMENFYRGQAEAYDGFRRRLLQGTRRCFRRSRFPRTAFGSIWAAGPAKLEHLGNRVNSLRKVYVVDLAAVAAGRRPRGPRKRAGACVETVHADATTFRPAEPVDAVTFSYSLTMIPDWFAAVENARAMLKPGGTFGAVDSLLPQASRRRDGSPRMDDEALAALVRTGQRFSLAGPRADAATQLSNARASPGAGEGSISAAGTRAVLRLCGGKK